MLHNEGIDISSIMRNRKVDNSLFFSCNYVNKNMHYIIKIVSFWYLDQVLIFLLDSDAAIGDNTNTIDAANIFLTKDDYFIDSSIMKTK